MSKLDEHAYVYVGLYDCAGQPKKHTDAFIAIHYNWWQIHVKTEEVGSMQYSFKVFLWYDENHKGESESDHNFCFFISVFIYLFM